MRHVVEVVRQHALNARTLCHFDVFSSAAVRRTLLQCFGLFPRSTVILMTESGAYVVFLGRPRTIWNQLRVLKPYCSVGMSM